MKRSSKADLRRIDLGSVSTSTRGGVSGTLEDIGLFRPAIQVEDR